MKKAYYLLPLLLVVLACGLPAQPTPDVSTIVNATLTAVAQSNPQVVPSNPAPTDAQPSGGLIVQPTDSTSTGPRDYFPPMGMITGKLSYPSSFIPAMRVAFFNSADKSFMAYIDTAAGQGTYTIEIPEGSYYVVSYVYDPVNYSPPAPGTPVFGGGYTAAVPCGLSVDCTDHSLIPVTVIANQTVTADPGDWYAPDNSFPPMPYP